MLMAPITGCRIMMHQHHSEVSNTHPTTPPRGGKRSKSAKVAESGEAVDVEPVAAGDGADDVVVT